MIESRSVVAWSEEWGGRARGNFWVWYVHYLSYGDCLMAIHIWQNLLYTLNIYSLLYLYLNKTVFKKAGFSFPLSLQIRSSNYTNKRKKYTINKILANVRKLWLSFPYTCNPGSELDGGSACVCVAGGGVRFCTIVGEVGLEVSAGFLDGKDWYIFTSWWSSVLSLWCRGSSWGISRGVGGLRKTLGTLSANFCPVNYWAWRS